MGAVENGLGSGLTTTAKIRFFRRRNAIAIGPRQPDVALYQLLREAIVRKDAVQLGARWDDMYETSRNLGRGGITSMAVSAVDVALWDLKAKMLGVPVYVSVAALPSTAGGFTAYSEQQLCQQLAGWVNDGIPRVKMKIGRDPEADLVRVAAARAAIGERAELFVDANGAYSAQQAVGLAQKFAEQRVTWFEEPVYREDYAGTRFVREHAPPGMDISSGEYGYGLYTFARMLAAQTVAFCKPTRPVAVVSPGCSPSTACVGAP